MLQEQITIALKKKQNLLKSQIKEAAPLFFIGPIWKFGFISWQIKLISTKPTQKAIIVLAVIVAQMRPYHLICWKAFTLTLNFLKVTNNWKNLENNAIRVI